MSIQKCLIIGHLSLGDQFIINGLVRYFSLKYSQIYLLCKRINLKSIISIYIDNNSIIPISVDTDKFIIDNDHYIFDLYKECDIIKIGMMNNNWYIYKSDLILDNLPYLFFETFYKQLDLLYDIRYKFEKIYRNLEREQTYYQLIMENYIKNNSKYIFIHDNDNILFNKLSFNIPIFHPNYQHHNYNNGVISDNITDYCTILEKSYEIHVTFSSFFNLCVFLDLSKVSNKYIYTNVVNIKDLHVNLKDWNIISL